MIAASVGPLAAGALVRLLREWELAVVLEGTLELPMVYLVDSAGVNLPYQGGVFPGQGVTRFYSAWFRNASTTFCPPATANVTNGWMIDW